jgi:hypothetical protein
MSDDNREADQPTPSNTQAETPPPLPSLRPDGLPLFSPDVAMFCARCGGRRETVGATVCHACAALPPPIPPDLWPMLIADVERGLQAAPSLDIRQQALARRMRARVLEMLRTRAAEAGPVQVVASTVAIDRVIDACLGLYAVARVAPPEARKVLEQVLTQQLQVLQVLALVSRPAAAKGEG